jgi:hypothetical protein
MDTVWMNSLKNNSLNRHKPLRPKLDFSLLYICER